MMTFKGICLIDPSITNHVGHYAEYARAICNAARELEHPVRVLAHRTVFPDLIRDLNAEPVFRYDFWRRFVTRRGLGFVLDPLIANWAFYHDLRRALKPSQSEEWVIFAPMTDHRQMLGWARWLSQVPPAHFLKVVLLFRYSYYEPEPIRRRSRSLGWARLGFRALERVARRRLRLATDSARLAAEYQQLTQIPIEVFPIPHTADLGCDLQPANPAPARPIRFVSLGDARTEKGFTLIAEVIRRLHAQKQMEGIEFVIQCNIGSEVYAALIKTRQALANMCLSNVHLVDKALSREAYNRLLLESDVVLLPYSRGIYYARTSGPFTEALAAGKPVIVTEDTWMSDQLDQYGAGLTFRDGDADALTQAILEASARYLELAEQARLRRPQWVAFHNPHAFVRHLLEEA